MRWVLRVAALAAVFLLGYEGYVRLGGAQTPTGQLSLTDLDQTGFTGFEQMFDRASDRVRIVALLSPT